MVSMPRYWRRRWYSPDASRALSVSDGARMGIDVCEARLRQRDRPMPEPGPAFAQFGMRVQLGPWMDTGLEFSAFKPEWNLVDAEFDAKRQLIITVGYERKPTGWLWRKTIKNVYTMRCVDACGEVTTHQLPGPLCCRADWWLLPGPLLLELAYAGVASSHMREGPDGCLVQIRMHGRRVHSRVIAVPTCRMVWVCVVVCSGHNAFS